MTSPLGMAGGAGGGTPAPSAFGRRRRTGSTGSAGGDGGYDANGIMRQPGQAMQGDATQFQGPQHQQRPQFNTAHPQNQMGGGAAQPQQTFAQMQEQGLARPAPPPAAMPQMAGAYAPSDAQNQFGTQLQNSVSQALNTPSRYDLPQVQQVRDSLTGQLEQQFTGQRKQMDEEMARRGLSASSIASGYYGDLAGQQSRALADMNAQLIKDAAGTFGSDRSSALAAGQNFNQSQASQGLAGYQANLAGTQANNAAGLARDQFGQDQYNADRSAAFSGAQAQESTRQFDLQQQLARQLGLGGLGVQQGQLDLARTGQGQQFGLDQQRLAEQSRQFNTGNALDRELGLGSQGLQARGQDIQSNQFMQDLYQRQFENQQSNNLANRGFNIEEQGMGQEMERFYQSLYDQQAGSKDANALTGRGLDLQQQGMGDEQNRFMQDLYQRQFENTQSNANANRGMNIQEQGMGQDKEQFYQSLYEQQAARRAQNDLQGRQVTADEKLANNQLLLQLTQAIGGLDKDALDRLFNRNSPPPKKKDDADVVTDDWVGGDNPPPDLGNDPYGKYLRDLSAWQNGGKVGPQPQAPTWNGTGWGAGGGSAGAPAAGPAGGGESWPDPGAQSDDTGGALPAGGGSASPYYNKDSGAFDYGSWWKDPTSSDADPANDPFRGTEDWAGFNTAASIWSRQNDVNSGAIDTRTNAPRTQAWADDWVRSLGGDPANLRNVKRPMDAGLGPNGERTEMPVDDARAAKTQALWEQIARFLGR